MKLSAKILTLLGWQIGDVCLPKKCVIVLAPHTSNWDFVYGILYRSALGIQTHFTIKNDWFRFPFRRMMERLGGIPIDRTTHNGLVEQAVSNFRASDSYYIVITPEGTRRPNSEWHTGCVRIAAQAEVPIAMAYIDYKNKTLGVNHQLHTPSGNIAADIMTIKNAYSAEQARYPEKFRI